jgi:hypothetical protein
MKVKNKLVFKHEIEDRSYSMVMDANSPLGEAYQAAGAFLDEIIRLINEHAQKRVDAEKKEEEPEEDQSVSE